MNYDQAKVTSYQKDKLKITVTQKRDPRLRQLVQDAREMMHHSLAAITSTTADNTVT